MTINKAQALTDDLITRLNATKPNCNHHANSGLCREAAAEITRLKAVIARVHRFALAGDGAGYDLILSVTDPIVGREVTQTEGE